MVAKHLNLIDVGCGNIRGGDVVFAAEKIQALYVELGDVLAQVLYRAGLSDIYSGQLLDGVLEGIVASGGIGGKGI